MKERGIWAPHFGRPAAAVRGGVADALLQDEAVGDEEHARDLQEPQPPLVLVWAAFDHRFEAQHKQPHGRPGAEQQVVQRVDAAKHHELAAGRRDGDRGDEAAKDATHPVRELINNQEGECERLYRR